MTVNFKIPQSPQVTLYASIGGTDTSIRLTPFPQDLDGNNLAMADFGVFGTATIDPKVSGFEEIIGFTGMVDNGDGTCTLTGVTRDLQSVYPYTGTGTGNNHGSSATVVFGINPQGLAQFPSRNNDELIPGNWTFSGLVTFSGSFPITPSNPLATDSLAGIAKTAVHAYLVDSGAVNALTLTPSVAVPSYVAGQIFTLKVLHTNTGAVTLNVSAIGAASVLKNVSAALVAGDILAGQLIQVEYDGTNFQLITAPATVSVPSSAPNVVRLTAQNFLGSTSTQFTITNPSGTTFTYTYTGTGTSPGTLSTLMPVGSIVSIQSTSMSQANTGLFTVTANTATSFSVTNASGVAEATKTLANGYLDIGTVYTPTTGTKYVVIEMVGGGYPGGSGTSTTVGNGGAAGGYLRKLLASGFSGLQGIAGPAVVASTRTPYGLSAFGASLVANGATATDGGTASGGDITFKGQGNNGGTAFNSTGGGFAGANSPLGAGGNGTAQNTNGGNASGFGSGGGGAGSNSSGTDNGGNSAPGAIIITEHFI